MFFRFHRFLWLVILGTALTSGACSLSFPPVSAKDAAIVDTAPNKDAEPIVDVVEPDAHVHFCGDGVVDPGEVCDDGNQSDGDGCSSDCQFATKYFARYVGSTPVIDGRLDEYDGTQSIVITNPANATIGLYRLVWDDTHLYLAVDVQDTNLDATALSEDEHIYADDGFDLYLDTAQDRGTVAQDGDFHIIANILDAVADFQGWNIHWSADIVVASQIQGTIGNDQDTDSGYQMEMAIPWADMGLTAPSSGQQWCMDITLNDRLGTDYVQIPWWNSNGGYDTDPDGWGTMVFFRP